MKKILILIPLVLLTIWNCTKEEADAPYAKIHTNLVNNTIAKSAKFSLYLDQTHGEFITYFKGDAPKRTYTKGDYTIAGSSIPADADSVEISYGVVGQYTLTLLARSYGNWGDEELTAIDSVRITVE
jgi:hypothetical protein